MTGEQKPGGLEVAGHVVWWKEGGVSFIRAGEPVSVDKSCRVEPVIFPEPAEARIRELEAERDAWKALAENGAQALPQYITRATAAEAKLARAVEGLKTARETLDAFDCALTTDRPVAGAARRAVKRIDQTLAALQQEGE